VLCREIETNENETSLEFCPFPLPRLSTVLIFHAKLQAEVNATLNVIVCVIPRFAGVSPVLVQVPLSLAVCVCARARVCVFFSLCFCVCFCVFVFVCVRACMRARARLVCCALVWGWRCRMTATQYVFVAFFGQLTDWRSVGSCRRTRSNS